MLQSFKKFDHYRRAALITLPAALALLIYVLCGGDFLLPEWFFDVFMVGAFVGNPLSGATYLARPLDKEPKSAEKIGTVLFALAGLVATIFIARAAAFCRIPLSNSLGKPVGNLARRIVTRGATYGLFGLANTSTYAGLGNRLGSCVQSSRPTNERATMAVGAAVGIGLGAVCVKHALFTALSVFVPGAALALPTIASSILLTTGVASTAASAGDYTAKAWNYAKYAVGCRMDTALKQRIENQRYEYRGSAVGVVLGIALGVVAFALMPHVVVGGLLVAAVVKSVVTSTCCSVVGGLFSRIGRVWDGVIHAREKSLAAAKDHQVAPKLISQTSVVQKNSSHAPGPQLKKGPVNYGSYNGPLASVLEKQPATSSLNNDIAQLKHYQPVLQTRPSASPTIHTPLLQPEGQHVNNPDLPAFVY